MSIFANINAKNAAVKHDSRFVCIADDPETYVKKVEEVYADAIAASESDDSGSDHFVSTMGAVDTAAKLYKNALGTGDPAKVKDVLDKIMLNMKTTPALCRWLCAVLCALVYGYDSDNRLEVRAALFNDDAEEKGVFKPNKYSFLKIWKRKFNSDEDAQNHNNVLVADPGSPDGTVPRTADGKPAIDVTYADDRNGLNLVTFGSLHYPQVLGSYSRKYFVIPLREMNLIGQPKPAWKEKFCDLTEHPAKLRNLDREFDPQQKALLLLSAYSVPDTAPDPMLLVQGIIRQYITSGGLAVTEDSRIVYKKLFNGIKLFRIRDVIDIDALMTKTLYVGRSEDGSIHATYPFTADCIRAVESKRLSLRDLKLTVETDNSRQANVRRAALHFNYDTMLRFESEELDEKGANIVPEGMEEEVPAFIPLDKEYLPGQMHAISNMRTFCMFPNLPVNYESACARFTYFSRSDSFTLLDPPGGTAQSTELRDGSFRAVIDRSGCKRDILRERMNDTKDKGAAVKPVRIRNVELNAEAELYTNEASVVSHFIEVLDKNQICFGYVMNMKLSTGEDVPALLPGNGTPVNISFEGNPPTDGTVLRALVDYGSSSSCVRYSISNGKPSEGRMVERRTTVRRVLMDYARSDYAMLINDPDDNAYDTFPTVSTSYDESIGFNSYYPYTRSWMPVSKSFTAYRRYNMQLCPSDKTLVRETGGNNAKSPNIVISNICYTVACYAVEHDCSDVLIVPSLPSDDYKENLKKIWESAINEMRTVFPSMRMKLIYDSPNLQFLYESIAISNGVSDGSGNPNLRINVDIGDGTTDMSAIIYTNTGARLCGYSSMEYAGKQLAKRVFSDIFGHTGYQTAEDILNGYNNAVDVTCPSRRHDNSYNPLFIGDAAYAETARRLRENFYDSSRKGERREKPEDVWESNVIDLLNCARMNGDNIDRKIALNFILRYMIMMPVIRDFIKVAIALAGEDFVEGKTPINITFFGGSAKGIDLFKDIDSRPVNAGTLMQKYFSEEFPTLAKLSVYQGDSKYALTDGLAKLTISNQGVISNAGMAAVDWGRVNPCNFEIFGEPGGVHSSGMFRFEYDREHPGDAGKANRGIVRDYTNYFGNPGQPYCDPSTTADDRFPDFDKYFNEVIFGRLIDNKNGMADVMEELILDFTKQAGDGMKADIRQLIGGTGKAFERAVSSSIYPEMMKSAAFMFAMSDLLTKYHGPLCDTSPITTHDQAREYRFGKAES